MHVFILTSLTLALWRSAKLSLRLLYAQEDEEEEVQEQKLIHV